MINLAYVDYAVLLVQLGRGMSYKYQQVADTIIEQIKSGAIAPGDRLLTAKQMRERFGASYGTIRSAILILKSQGYIEGRQGDGMYVK